jgi:hypothetical protein|tara:strand:+ start:8973 stop:9161 length:189 start_codon:yes stop_codon:yes gene_type:complete
MGKSFADRITTTKLMSDLSKTNVQQRFDWKFKEPLINKQDVESACGVHARAEDARVRHRSFG